MYDEVSTFLHSSHARLIMSHSRASSVLRQDPDHRAAGRHPRNDTKRLPGNGRAALSGPGSARLKPPQSLHGHLTMEHLWTTRKRWPHGRIFLLSRCARKLNSDDDVSFYVKEKSVDGSGGNSEGENSLWRPCPLTVTMTRR